MFDRIQANELIAISTKEQYPIDAKFPNQTTGTADKFAFRDRENC